MVIHLGTVRPRLIAFVLGIVFAPELAHAQNRTSVDWQREFERARQLADAGSLREAENIFNTGTLSATADAQTRAYAYFGRAFVAQQRFVERDTAGTPVLVDSILADYSRAKSLDPGGIAIAAHNNAGTFLRALGRGQEASKEFLAAAMAGPHPDRATFYLNAGLEFAARTTPSGSDSAGWSLREAVKLAPTRSDVLRAYSSWLARTLRVPALLDSLAGWRADTLRAEIAANAISSVLLRKQPQISETDAAQALVAFAGTLPVMQISPETFDAKYRARLDEAAVLHSSIADGARALEDAMAPRTDKARYRPTNASRWWVSGPPSTDVSRAAWSSVLRWIGDWYFQQNRQELARWFYEAGLGGDGSLNNPWIDRRALVPLAMIYVEREDRQGNAKLQHDVRQFTEILFSAKGHAYARGDIEQIRDFHLTLGTIYAAKGQWKGAGPDNAEYQIDHLRQASRTLRRQTGRPENIPPELLTKLAVHYQQSGKTSEADDVKGEIRTQFRRQGRTDAGEQLVRKIDADALNPDALKAVRKISTMREPSRTGVVPQPQVQRIKPTVVTARPDSAAHLISPTSQTLAVPTGEPIGGAAARPVSDSVAKLPAAPVTGQVIATVTEPVAVSVGGIAATLFQISGRVRSAAGALLRGVAVEIDIQGKTRTVRTGSDGVYKVGIPRNVDSITVHVVHLNEQFTRRMRPISRINIRLVPAPKN